MHDPDATEPTEPTESTDTVLTEPSSTESPRADAVMDEELDAAEIDLDSIGAVLDAIDRDDLDTAEEIVTGLDAGGAEPV